MVSTGDDQACASEKAGRTQAGPSQTTTKVALAERLISALGGATESTSIPCDIRRGELSVGREMPWLTSLQSRPIQQALSRRSLSQNNDAPTDAPVRGSDWAAPGNELPGGRTRVQLRYQA